MSTVTDFTSVRGRIRAFNASVQAGAPALPVEVDSIKIPNRNFTCYGNARKFWESSAPILMLSGPAETGKTTVVLHKLDHILWNNPGAQAAIVRKTYSDMPGTVLQSFETKVIKMVEGRTADGIVKHGGQFPQSYTYPNGSKIWIGGLDKPGKVLSSERDVVVVNQAEQLEKDDWEIITTRTTGRAGVLQPARLIGDCNPGPSTHWILSLAAEGALEMIHTLHTDNPTLYNPITGEITPQGERSIGTLSKLTGVRRKRYLEGLWVSAEGAVYEDFNKDLQTIDEPVAPFQSYIGGVDWGLTNPGVLQVWGIDGDKRMTRVAETYRTGKLVAGPEKADSWWINEALRYQAIYNVKKWKCDPSEPAYITAFVKAGLPAEPAYNRIPPGIQAVLGRMVVQKDARYRLYLMRNSKPKVDETLAAAHKPLCLEDEIEVYSWPKDASGKVLKEVPVDDNNHACDAMRYVVCEVDGIGSNNFFYA
jgi:PBSX family phage terminase large subunit